MSMDKSPCHLPEKSFLQQYHSDNLEAQTVSYCVGNIALRIKVEIYLMKRRLPHTADNYVPQSFHGNTSQ